eukprot:scaffold165235_cov34-Prasinocladus_malaysianus.AAC.1
MHGTTDSSIYPCGVLYSARSSTPLEISYLDVLTLGCHHSHSRRSCLGSPPKLASSLNVMAVDRAVL